jgi:hypothetical protein
MSCLKGETMNLFKYMILVTTLCLGCDTGDNFNYNPGDDDDTFVADDDDVIDDDDTSDDDDTADNPCPNSFEQINIPAGTYFFLGHETDNPSYVPQVRPEGEYTFDGLTCIEECRFPGCGAQQIGQHDVIGDGLTYRMVEYIADHAPDMLGRRLCTSAEHQAASALPDDPAYGYSDEYQANACDSSLNPTTVYGELSGCVSALGVKDVTQRGDWTIVDQQTSDIFNQWSEDHDWLYLGPESEELPARIEENWLAVSGGVNDRCGESFYGCFINSLHWHVYHGDPFSFNDPDVEYDDDTLRFCVDIDNPPTEEQDTLYQQLQEEARDKVSYEPLLEELGWFEQPASATMPRMGTHSKTGHHH